MIEQNDPIDDPASMLDGGDDWSLDDCDGVQLEFSDPNRWRQLCTTPSGKFKFPNYSRRTKDLVQITDSTDLKDSIGWEDLDADEKRDYSYDDFEGDVMLDELEVDDFADFIANKKNPYLGELKAIRNDPDAVPGLVQAMFEDETCTIEESAAKGLRAGSYVYSLDIPEAQYAERTVHHLTRLKVPALNKLAEEHGFKPGKTKFLTAEKMVHGGYVLPMPVEYVPAPKFIEWAQSLFNRYLEEVEKSMQRFPPGTHHSIWDAVRETDSVYTIDFFEKMVDDYQDRRAAGGRGQA